MNGKKFLHFFVLALVFSAFSPHNVDQPPRKSHATNNLLAVTNETWKASSVTTDCNGPSDSNGKMWYAADFDDSPWTIVQLPEINTIPSGKDRYYRMGYNWSGASKAKIQLSSDDGSWLYVNGQFVGHWGADCHGGGRADSATIDITSYLQQGNNVLAVHVSNGPSDSLFNLITPQRIMLTTDSQVTVEFVSTSTACTGDF